QVGTKDEEAWRDLPRRQAVAVDAGGVVVTPRLCVANLAKDRQDLDAFDRLRGDVLQLEGDARHELVLAVLDAGVVPAGMDIGDLDGFLDVELVAAAGQAQRGRDEEHHPLHDPIVAPRQNWFTSTCARASSSVILPAR